LSVPVTRFERDTLAIVLREPSVGSILIGKHFQTVGMIDPVIGIARPNLSGCILSGVFIPVCRCFNRASELN
jgi:hypothetical protein